ncbi:MAG: terminase large subunit domain-containing protein [Deltaproteobacteria bacterium]
MAEITIPYNPNKKQEVFHECNADEAVYGGAKGGGKSCALVMESLAYGLENSGAEIYLFRETYDDLEANLIKEWKQKVPKELYTYNESKHIATLINGTTVKFRYIRNFQDAEGYQGRSMDFIGVDELTKHEKKSIQVLLSCLRSPKGFKPRFRATCNPGGIGHVWVKTDYILATKYGRKTIIDPITGNKRAFIPAKVYDNEILMKNDPTYVKRLENLPEAQKKAFLYGDWDVFEGQAFEEWNYDIHVVQPFIIPAHWAKWRSCDNGYTDPFAWYWLAVDEQGTVFIYREFTRDYEDPKISYSDQAKRVIELSGNENISATVCGHDAWNVHHLTITQSTPLGKSFVDYYADGGLYDCTRAITDRTLRKTTWHEYLKPYFDENIQKTTSKVKIFSTCTKLIETLPQLIMDEKDPEKVKDCTIDHWYDGAGYGLIYNHSDSSLAEEAPKEEKLIDKMGWNKPKNNIKMFGR